MSDLGRVLDKLARLRAKDSTFQVFGADKHRYELNPCLTEPMIRDYELAHEITLPPDYRTFLLNAGNGGAGPYYGIEPLGEAAPYRDKPAPPQLSQPFPLTARLEMLDACLDGVSADEYYERIEEDEEYYEQVQECMAQYYDPKYRQGTLDVCQYGDAISFFLVVSGAERDHVWIDDTAHDGGYFPLVSQDGPDSRVDFLTWYENWLDGSLRRLDGAVDPDEDGTYFEFGYTVTG